jgi:hypothetical protein
MASCTIHSCTLIDCFRREFQVSIHMLIHSGICNIIAVKLHHINYHCIFKFVVFWDTLPCMFVFEDGDSRFLLNTDTKWHRVLNGLPLKFIFRIMFFIHSQLQSFPAYVSMPVMVFRGCDFGFSLAATFINFLLCITQCFLQLVVILSFGQGAWTQSGLVMSRRCLTDGGILHCFPCISV